MNRTPERGVHDLCIVIVSYETRDLTIACVQSVLRETRSASFDIVVVDNASTDGSVDALRTLCPEAHTIALSENIGFGAAANLGAKEKRSRYVLLLNPDTRVLNHAIDELIRFADDHPSAGIYGGLTEFDDGTLNLSSCWNRPTLWSAYCQGLGLSAVFNRCSLFNPESIPFEDTDRQTQPIQVDIVSGGFLLIRRLLWEALDGFDPIFFMYGEDFDLNLRARRLGATPLIDRAARIVHHGGASERQHGDRLVRLLRSKSMLIERHWTPGAAWLGKLALLIWAGTRRIAYGPLARLRGRGGSPNAQAWREVWQRRNEILFPAESDGRPRSKD